MEPTFDEPALRREDFQGGRPVVLADGQPWFFPCPMVDLAPTFGPDGDLTGADSLSSFGPGFDALIAQVRATDLVIDEATAMFRLAVDMLDRNYRLTPDHYRSLLRYRPDREAGNETLAEIFRIAIGIGPKLTPAGSDSA